MSTKYTMRHTPQVQKVIAPKPIHAPHDGDCENCGGKFEVGDWVLEVSEGDYEYFIHEVCPSVAEVDAQQETESSE